MSARLTPGLRKAPRALLASPPLLAGTVAAALLLAFAASSSSLFTTAAGSSAFKEQVAAISPLGGGIVVFRSGRSTSPSPAVVLRAHAARGRAIQREIGRSADLGSLRDTMFTEPVAIESRGRSMDVLLMTRAGARQHVRLLQGGGDGLWVADTVAGQLRARTGDVVGIAPGFGAGSSPLRIGGVYRALWKDVAADDWVNFGRQIYPATRGDPDAPPTFALLPADELLRVYLAHGGTFFDEVWEMPVAVDGLTLERGRALARRLARVQADLALFDSPLSRALGCGRGEPFHQTRCSAASSLTSAISLADESADAVAAPARLLGGLGLAIALAVAAAVGVFLVTRRRNEARYLFARGEGAGGFALRTGVETAPALLLGGTAGFALTLALVRVLEPAASLDPAALRRAALVALAAVVAGAVLLVAAATVVFLRQFDTAPPALARLRLVPWELAVLGLGIWLLVAIRHGSGLSGNHPSLLVFAMPLLLLAGVAGMVLRLVRLGLRRTDGRGIAVYLAARRAAAGSGLLVALTILCAVSLGVLLYGQALRASLDTATRQKAQIAIGGDVQGSVDPGAPVPRLPFPATTLQVAYGGAAVGGATGRQVDLMEVDPATLPAAVHWNDGWGPRPERFAPLLARRGGALPVVVAGPLGRLPAIWISGVRIPVRVVARVRAFPGMSTASPLVVTARGRLRAASGGLDPIESGLGFVWARGPVPQVERALSASLLRPEYYVSIDDILRNRDVVAARRAYQLLTALGVGVAALALVGVGLYLYARQRAQAVASALARRMGLARRLEVLSIWLEVAAILVTAGLLAAGVGLAAAAPVIRRIDPLPRYSPEPGFAVPWPVVGAVFAALLLVALVAAVATSLAARRADVAQELRLG